MDLRIGPADLSRLRRPRGVAVTFGASFDGQTWKFKVDIGRGKAGDQGHLPGGRQARSPLPDDGRAGLTWEPSSQYPEYGPGPQSIRQAPSGETHGPGPGAAPRTG